MSVGVLGLGTYLPEMVRTNDYWAKETVDRWRRKAESRLTRVLETPPADDSEDVRRVTAALAEIADDPFRGARERRVMPPGMAATDMETAAARAALADAGVEPGEIDLVLSYTMCPDAINVPGACVVHHNLGLPARCFTLAVDAVCNSFMMQLSIARQMIAGGRARRGLLVQSSAITRLPPSGEPHDAWFGDAATAVVVGPVSPGRGILGEAQRTDGRLHRALLCGIPGRRWFDDGPVITYSDDPRAARDMLLLNAERARQVVGEALREAGLGPEQIDFYASHQATVWFRRVTQEAIGLDRARSVDTFPWAGTVSAANLPLVLASGRRDGLLRDGDAVAMFQGGTGVTWAGMVVRWGR